MIGELFHSLFIWPIQFFIEIFFMVFMKLLKGQPTGIVIILLSFTINIFLLPIYIIADHWQDEERDIQKRMRKKLKDIRAVFKGDERHMIISTYYRQMGYSPLYSIRSSIGLFLQIPIFIAAYNYLSHSSYLHNSSFLFLQNLSQPDRLLSIGGLSVNLLPVIMTVINLVSAFVYTKNLQLKDKIQLIVMAMIFLVFLYNSPSGLVLYWTLNNIFSLVKNSSKYLNDPADILYKCIIAACIGLYIYIFIRFNDFKKIYLIGLLGINTFITVSILGRNKIVYFLQNKTVIKDKILNRQLFILSAVNMFLLSGLVIPVLLFASSPAEFEAYNGMLVKTIFQSASVFLLIPSLIWIFSPDYLKKWITPVFILILMSSMFSCFVLSGDYGSLTQGFVFEKWSQVDRSSDLLTTVIALFIPLVIFAGFIFVKKLTVLKTILSLSIISTIIVSSVNLYKINSVLSLIKNNDVQNETVYNLSKTGENVFVIFLDRAPGHLFSAALKEYPEFYDEFDGFIWYPDTISFGPNTMVGLSSMVGGYEYRPSEINKRDNVLLKDKVNESLKVLPRIFSEKEYKVTVTDPTYSNLSWIPDPSIYSDVPGVTAVNIAGIFRNRFIQEQGGASEKGFSNLFDYDITTRFSLFRLMPPVARSMFYYDGNWMKMIGSSNYNQAVKYYPNLLYLNELCSISENGNTFNLMMNDSTHNPGAHNSDLELTSDEIIYSDEDISRFGSVEDVKFFYTFSASFKALTGWFEWLKAEKLYNNTKIIIVSDHGWYFHNNELKSTTSELYNPVLLVKDFNSEGKLEISDEFMTNADMPSLAVSHFDKVSNPYSSLEINNSAKMDPVYIYGGPWKAEYHGEYKLVVDSIEELKERDIKNPENWVKVK